MALTFDLIPNPTPRTDDEVAAIVADPGFGDYFTDHMALANWTKGQGWHDAQIKPYGPFLLDPSAAVLHYGQEIFEGMKAYRHADGSIWLFRPQKNAQRFITSAARLMLPELPIEDYLASLVGLLQADHRWVPSGEAGEMSLYLRPYMFASEAFLGVRAAEGVTYAVIASPVGPYFTGGVKPINIWVTTEYSRAGRGGTGAVKCGGNYASSLIAQYEGYDHGCSQVLFGDAASGMNAEELGGMNVMLITAEGTLVTPGLSGTILDGVTRDSILTVAGDLGLATDVRPITLAEIFEGIAQGHFVEAFACGTAAVITPVGEFRTKEGNYPISQDAGPRTLAIRNRILDIQYGRVEDTHSWMVRAV
ncbi:MAG: branched-chain amino acid aminotransferase [Micropruina sp.]